MDAIYHARIGFGEKVSGNDNDEKEISLFRNGDLRVY